MKKVVVSLVIALTMLIGTGCSISINSKPTESKSASTAPAPKPEVSGPESAFLEVVRSQIPELQQKSDSVILNAGQEVCTGLRKLEPLTAEKVVAAATAFADGTGFMTPEEGAYFIGASAATFCPEISREIQELTAGSNI